MSVGARDGQALPGMLRRAGWKGAAGSPSQCHVGAPLPLRPPLPLGRRSRRCPSPGLLVCKALVQAAARGHPPVPGEQPIPISLLLSSHPGAGHRDPAAASGRGSDPEPSCQAGKRLRKLLRRPRLAPRLPPRLRGSMHTRRSTRPSSRACREDATSPTKVSLASELWGGEAQSSSQRSWVTGGRFSLSLAKVGVLMGRKLLRATICTEGADLPRGNQPCGQRGQPPRHGAARRTCSCRCSKESKSYSTHRGSH